MKNEQQSKPVGSPVQDPTIAEDALRMTCSIRVAGRNVLALELTSSFDMPLALRHAQLHSALLAYPVLFEHSVVTPAHIAMTEFIENRFLVGRKANTNGAAATPKGTNASPALEKFPSPISTIPAFPDAFAVPGADEKPEPQMPIVHEMPRGSEADSHTARTTDHAKRNALPKSYQASLSGDPVAKKAA